MPKRNPPMLPHNFVLVSTRKRRYTAEAWDADLAERTDPDGQRLHLRAGVAEMRQLLDTHHASRPVIILPASAEEKRNG
jgi:hypothetical protein